MQWSVYATNGIALHNSPQILPSYIKKSCVNRTKWTKVKLPISQEKFLEQFFIHYVVIPRYVEIKPRYKISLL